MSTAPRPVPAEYALDPAADLVFGGHPRPASFGIAISEPAVSSEVERRLCARVVVLEQACIAAAEMLEAVRLARANCALCGGIGVVGGATHYWPCSDCRGRGTRGRVVTDGELEAAELQLKRLAAVSR